MNNHTHPNPVGKVSIPRRLHLVLVSPVTRSSWSLSLVRDFSGGRQEGKRGREKDTGVRLRARVKEG